MISIPGMYERTYRIRGLTPTLMANGRMANPLDPYAREVAKVKAKPAKQKTLEDFEKIARFEFEGSLYLAEADKNPGWPGENIEAMLLAASKTKRQGQQARRGISVDGIALLEFDGPKTVEKMWDAGLWLTAMVGGKQGSRPRTRPMFSNWELEFTALVQKDQFDPETLDEMVGIAGRLISLSDWRPRYGKFEVVSIDGKAVASGA